MSNITFQQNILIPPIMYHNIPRYEHMASTPYGSPRSLSYPYLEHVSFSRLMSFGNQDHMETNCADLFPKIHCEDSQQRPTKHSESTQKTMTSQHDHNTIKTEVHRSSCMRDNGASSDVVSPRPCNLAPTSPQRLTLPNIRASNNFAKNVMNEESDLGYYSFCDVSDIKLDEISTDPNSTQSYFSNIIDDVLDSLDGEMYSINSARHTDQSVMDDLNGSEDTHTSSIPCAFQNVTFNFHNPPPEVTTPPSWSRDLRKPEEHVCYTCNKTFGTKQEMVIHMRLHKDGRPHNCPYCKKSFTQRSTLRTHIRTHTGEKPFSCPSCARAFSDYSTYRKHLRIHSGEKPYVCDVCNKGFTQSGNMIRHREIHFKKTRGSR